jgi:hypothetical protein
MWLLFYVKELWKRKLLGIVELGGQMVNRNIKVGSYADTTFRT